MQILAFTDGDGYYQIELADGEQPPEWTRRLTPYAVQSQPAPTHDELVSVVLAKTHEKRLPIMGVLDGLQTSALVTGETVVVNGITKPLAEVIEWSKQSLRDITTTDLSACTTQAEMELAIFQAYQAIAAAAPPSVQTAFQNLVP